MLINLKSFYSKLSIIFLMLILLLGMGILFITFTASSRLFDEVEQLLNIEYASSIASELQPIVEEEFSITGVKSAIHYMMVLNPMVEIYLINSAGKILGYFTAPGATLQKDSIDLEPIFKFLEPNASFPILGDDPRSLKGRKPFSVANLKMGSDNGFVYVVLRGEDYDKSIKGISSSYYIRTGLSTFIIAIFLTLIIGFLLFFLLTKRLRILSKAVLDFKTGNFDARVDINGNDEITILGETFNQMAESIKLGIERLKLADKEKSDLITNISHDLRSPLTSIRGYLETIILKKESIEDSVKNEYIEISIKNINKLQKLVDNLFDLAKLENKSISLNKEVFQITELVQDVVIKVNPLANTKNILINLEEPKNIPLLSGDIGMIERVISNLVENAINYTNQDGTININILLVENYIKIRIQDTGLGIPTSEISSIFDRFYRVSGNKRPGSGLGLSIVKHIVSLHDGLIEVNSEVNVGSTFIISFPISN